MRIDEFLQRHELRSEVEVVDEGVFFVSYVYECRIEARHDLAHPAQIDIAHGETGPALLLVELDEDFVFAQGDRNLRRVYVYDEFSVHVCLFASEGGEARYMLKVLRYRLFVVEWRTTPMIFGQFRRTDCGSVREFHAPQTERPESGIQK